jgi:hypothetical protein
MAHFLLAATSLISSQYVNHLSNSHYQIWDEGLVGEYHLLTYGLKSFHHKGGTFVTATSNIICSNSERHINSDEVQFILRDYHRHSSSEDNLNGWMILKPNVTCALMDHSRKWLWLIGDESSTHPLWFSHEDDRLLITTDLLGALSLGHLEMKVVGAGVTLAIDLTSSSHKILQVNHWPQSAVRDKSEEGLAMLLSEAHRLLDPFLSASTFITTELNPLDESSVLFECALATHPNQAHRSRVTYQSLTPASPTPPLPLIGEYSSCTLPPSLDVIDYF